MLKILMTRTYLSHLFTKMTSSGSIASGISSPPLKRRVVEGIASPRNPAVSPMGSGVRGGVRGLAGGIKGRPISAVPVVSSGQFIYL